MKKFADFLEKYILPFANNLAQTRWLVALRDAFITTMPITMAGSIAVLIISLVRVAKTELGWIWLYNAMQPVVAVSNLVWNGAFALFSLYFALTWGYQLAKSFETNRLAGAIVSVGSFAMSIANVTKIKFDNQTVNVKDAFNISQFSTTGLFTAILFGAVGVTIYILLIKARITIHLKARLPHAQDVAFTTLVPVILALSAVGLINYLFQSITGTYFGNWLLKTIQAPLVKMGQGFGMVLLITFLVQAFWFLGINGLGVLTPVLESIWMTPQNINLTAARLDHPIPFHWVRSSFDVFAWFGGAGGTLVLLIAILIFSKRTDYRTLAKVALAPSVFNINEPVVLGLPIVLNPVYMIPFIVAPMVNVAISYVVTILGWVNPVQVAVPSIMPPILNAFLACNYDWRAIVLVIVNMIIALFIWYPFVKAADKIAENNEPRNFYNLEY